MDRFRKAIRNKHWATLQVPGYIRREFLTETVRKNDFSLRIICAIIFPIELYNIARVLLWSQSGLGTRNNRIYFSMYCLLIFIGAVWLALRRPMRQASVEGQWIFQYAVTCLLLLWHIGLNTYDLYRDSGAGTAVLTTALLGLALLIQAPPRYSAALYGIGYLLFLAAMVPLLPAGDQLNLTITFSVALAVSLAHAHHTAVMLKQQKQIVEINAKLQELVQQDPLTGLLNKTTVECRVEQLLSGPERPGGEGGVTLFLMDLDRFKEINDHYGHPCGDHVLVEMADALRSTFADGAGVGRIGGDEFAVLYDRPLTESQVMALSESLTRQLKDIRWQGRPLDIRCSVGACVCPKGRCHYQQLYEETDRMLYRAKETGRDRCCLGQLECAKNSR